MSICKKPIKLYSKSLHCPAVTVQYLYYMYSKFFINFLLIFSMLNKKNSGLIT